MCYSKTVPVSYIDTLSLPFILFYAAVFSSSAFKCWYEVKRWLVCMHAWPCQILEVDVLDELGSALILEVPPWVPTACPGSQPQMVTGVFSVECVGQLYFL